MRKLCKGFVALLLVLACFAPARKPVRATPTGTGIYRLDVQTVQQQPELPNGCEAASLATLLQYHGYAVEKTTLADYYLPKQALYTVGGLEYGGDPEEAYPGEPRDDTGWYCWAAPLAQAANTYLNHSGNAHQAVNITGATLQDLQRQLALGNPVALWTTLEGEAPLQSDDVSWNLRSGGRLLPYTNVHCVVLTGCDGERLYFSNPLDTFSSMAIDDFMAVYTALGSRALVIQAVE